MKFRVPSMGSQTNVGLSDSFCPGRNCSSPKNSKSGYLEVRREWTIVSMALSVSVTLSLVFLFVSEVDVVGTAAVIMWPAS